MQWEQEFLLWLQTLHTGWLDALMVFFTRLGDYGTVWVSVGILLLFFPKYRRTGLLLLIALAAGYLLGDVVLKNLVERLRPFVTFPGTELLIPAPGSFSFPSGHTVSSFTAATVVFLTDRRFGTAAYCLAAVIAFSRMYLFVHYPTDVLAGLVFGVSVALLTAYLARKIRPPGRQSA